MHIIALILVRAGSKGLPDKCAMPLCGRPVVAHTIVHAQQSERVDAIVLSTDSPRTAQVARQMGVTVIDRPVELTTETATTQDAVRHAVADYESRTGQQVDLIVVLAGKVPLREDGLIDRCVDRLLETGADSVQTVQRVGKCHPDWMYRIQDGQMLPLTSSNIVSSKDLEPLYRLTGSVVTVRRQFLAAAACNQSPTAYLGTHRQAVVQEEDCVEIDSLADFYYAEALIRVRNEATFLDFPTGGTRRRPISAAIGHGAGYDRRHH